MRRDFGLHGVRSLQEQEDLFERNVGELNRKQTVSRREAVWVDGNGRAIPLREMETSHIINCIRVTSKKVDEWEEILNKYSPRNVIGSRQLELWKESITTLFAELAHRAL